MRIYDVYNQAARIAPAAILFLTLAVASHAQSVGACETQCRSDCEDSAIGKAAITACIAKCNCKQCHVGCQTGPAQIHPRYLILSVMYAPPGCSGSNADKCNPQGNVSYGQQSSVGTKVSAGLSFTSESKTTEGIKDVWNNTADYQVTTSDTATETVTKNRTVTLGVAATADGINHDLDVIALLVDPVVTVQQTASGALWQMIASGGKAEILYVTVGGLKTQFANQPGLASQLKALGFTNSDFQTILAQDPFALNATAAIDPTRFGDTLIQLSYEPPDPNACTNGQCPCATSGLQISNQNVGDNQFSFKTQYTVGDSVGGLGSSAGGVGLQSDNSFTWSATASTDNTQQNTQTATLLLACPSPAYTSPQVEMNIYWDGLYGTFLFVPVEDTNNIVVQHGIITSAAGKPLAGSPVALSINGKTYRTFTDYRGRYRFTLPNAAVRSAPKSGELSVRSVRETVALRAAAATEIRVP